MRKEVIQRLIGSGQSWSSYWATLISATVENAAPNDVMLTFPSAKTSLIATDFDIDIYGNSIASASWAGNILTLTLTLPVVVYNGSFLVTFNKTGQTKEVTNNVNDGNTVAWYKYNDPVAGVVKDGANRVSVWLDKFNYAVGANILPNPLNFTSINWGGWGGTVINDYTFSSGAGASGIRSNVYTWTLNTTYRVRMRCNVSVGTTFHIRDYDATNNYLTVTGTGNFETYDMALTVTAISVNGIYLRLADLLKTVEFDYLIIEPVTGNHLLQYTVANQPVWSAANGVLFDGANDFLKAINFAFVQPEFIYFVGRQITWTDGDYFFDGNGANFGQLSQRTLSPRIRGHAGSNSAEDSNLALNTFGIVRVLFNGANSLLQVNKGASWNGDMGANNMGGFTLGARGDGIVGWGNIQVKEIILRRSADNADTQSAIYNYLENINGL